MLPPNTISRVLDYSIDHFRKEFERAFEEFFDGEILKSKTTISDADHTFFTEWWIYDFRLGNGRTVLEDFCEENPLRLSRDELSVYKKLLKNEYGLFQIVFIELEKGLTLRKMGEKKTITIQERSMTRQAEVGMWLPCRIATVGDHLESVGAASVLVPINFDAASEAHFREPFSSMDAREFWKTFVRRSYNEKMSAKKFQSEKMISLKEAERRLNDALRRCHIEQYISLDTIRYWYTDLVEDSDSFRKAPSGLIFGLEDDADVSEEDSNLLIRALQDFANAFPRKVLHGKSPNRVYREQKKRDRRGDWYSFTLDLSIWNKLYMDGMRAMRIGNFERAFDSYQKALQSLLEQRTTFRDVFRLYGNAGVTAFGIGEEYMGKRLLELASELNSHYDFAPDQMKRYRDGQYDSIIANALTKRIDLDIALEEKARRQGVWVAKGQRAPKPKSRITPERERMMMRVMTFLLEQNAGDGESARLIPPTKREAQAARKVFQQGPWYEYFQFLKMFRINFDHPPQKSTILTYSRLDGKKVGRNDSCPCGSGKKYKKCCGK